MIGEVESGVDLSRMMQDLPAVEDLLEAANDAPIIRMLNALLTQAAKDGASDIHIEPYERSSSVRFRVDGTLREVVQPNKALHAALISRLKIMAERGHGLALEACDLELPRHLGQRAGRRRLAGPQHEALAVVLEQQVVGLGEGVMQRVADGHRRRPQGVGWPGVPSSGDGGSLAAGAAGTGASGCACPGAPIGGSTGASLIGSTTLDGGCAPCCWPRIWS